jgi:hypothetical protein
MSPRPASLGLWLVALPRPRTAWPRLLSGGQSLRSVGELVASLVPALDAAPWLASPLGRLTARCHCVYLVDEDVGELVLLSSADAELMACARA